MPKPKPKRTLFDDPKVKERKGKKKDIKGLPTFFVLSCSLQGTTPALIKAKTYKQAHWLYTHAVLVPAKRKAKDLFKPNKLKKRYYYDGEIYIEQMKIWKWVNGYPISAIGMRIDFNFISKEDIS